jgi:two-component system chemotaxis response regulator CheB
VAESDKPYARAPGNRHIVAIGASSGGLPVLTRLLADLPPELPASVFVVLHLGPSSHLAEILGRASTLRVSAARNGQQIQLGQVYVAVPGVHLLVHDSHLMLCRGPRENSARPAIDPLFRSAACTFGSATIGVVLSGALNDGTAGLRAIQRCGGVTVVQDPHDAADPGMPASALRNVDVDHVAPASELASLLVRLVREPAGPTPPIPHDLRVEAAIATQELAGMKANEALGRSSRFTCPECHGTLWEIEDGSLLRFRCHVGHAYTGEAVLTAQEQETDRLLWSLMRMHQERAELAHRMAVQEERANRSGLARQLQQRAGDYEEDAEIIRRLIQSQGDTTAEGSEHDNP